ncbi:hypothetical protein F5051DRAFT_382295 [Lentinula edodes]|nr:hypothetical protein F5051DRAFT_382295 [Lentinula edodes]
MSAPKIRPRGIHQNPRPGTTDFEFGQKQAAQQLIYYHTLCAALQKKFSVSVSKGFAGPDANGRLVGDPGITLGVLAHRPLSDINFSEYTDFALESIREFKLEIRPGGLAPQEDLEIWHDMFKNNFETREGNVLSCTHGSCASEFWPIIHNYHACGDTGDPGWNKLFNRLKSEGYPKSIIPCRYFGAHAGCWDGKCPFLHDKKSAVASREAILKARRKTFDYKHKPTPQQSSARIRLLLNRRAGSSASFEEREVLMTQIHKEVKGDRAYCANPECMNPWTKDQITSPLKNCSRCKFVLYCSSQCQKKDWPRHKAEPCAPIEVLVENDDLWSPIGTRKGTEFFKTNWGGV